MRKRVLILTPFPPDGIGGAESFVKVLIQEVSKYHEVTLCTLKPRRKAWKGTGLDNFSSAFPLLMLYALFSQIIRPSQIIHAQGLISGLIAVLLKRIFKIKVFITLLALYEFDKKGKLFNGISNFIFQNCDIIFVEGNNGARDIHRFGVEAKIRIFQHWVDQDIFKPSQYRKNNKTRILFIGRPIHEKGRHIVEDAERLLEGKGYEFQYIDNAPLETLPAIYQMAHIVVVPSLYAEGFSRVVAEAASCGCMVLTSNKGSLPEMVKGMGKWSIEPTAEKFAEYIPWIICVGGEQFHKYAKENFSSKNAEVFFHEYSNS